MPFKPIETAKCPKCGKSVYAAEEKVAGGHKFHKGCFKCGMCGKFLDSTTVAEHEAELYCKNCHGRKYGPKGYGFGGGAGCLSMDTGAHLDGQNGSGLHTHTEIKVIQAPEGEGCPRCGGFVYAAEQMLARGRAFHKGCFKCGDCKKGLDSVNVCEGPDKDIYCKVCHGKKFGPKGYGFGQGCTLQSDSTTGGSDNAPKNVVIDTAVIQAKEGEGCPRCGGVVYAAELVLSKGREWHRKCYKCRDCTKTLDSIIACDGPDRDVYCRTCYGKKFGPRGFGYACGSGFLQTDGLTEEEISNMRPHAPPDTTSILAKDGEGCPRCGGVVFAAEQMLAKGSVWHKKCFSCAECHRPLDSVLACDGPDREIHCRSCYGKLFGPKGYGYGHRPTLSSDGESSAVACPGFTPGKGAKPKEGGCSRCGVAVYEAEKMISKGRVWHKRCFSCTSCNRSLDSTNLCDAPNGDIYCRNCYGRNFGPQGFGYGMGAGTLTTVQI